MMQISKIKVGSNVWRGNRHVLPAALTAMLAIAVMACAGNPAAPPVVPVEVTREVEVTRLVTETAPGQDPGKLVIYSGRSESLVDPIIQQFKGATGIDVQVKYASTGQLAATLLEEGDNSPADVFYAQDPGGLAAVSGMMSTLPADIIELTPQWARSSAGHWVGITGRGPRGGVRHRETQRSRPARRSVGIHAARMERPRRMGAHQRLVPGNGYRAPGRLG